jgi:ABC-2 type transport system ATP-binding protein
MSAAFELKGVTKRYGATVALDDVTLAVPPRSIVGLIGRNGSGKSTLLRHVTGFVLPDRGACITLGRDAAKLGRAELSRMGVVEQGGTLLDWMRGEQMLRYVASFYPTWDRALERSLSEALELDVNTRIGAMSPGNLQKLWLILATAHHPELLLLDEPLSDIDPIARQTVLSLLLDRFSSDDMTIVISSHMLHDIEGVVNRIICLDRGHVVADDELDDLRERYAEWIVTSTAGQLPETYSEPYVLHAHGDRFQSRLLVRDPAASAAAFRSAHDVSIESRPLNLEKVFPLLTNRARGGVHTGVS